MSEPDSPGKDGLLEEAAAWFARMRGPDAEESRAEFEKWLARGALHRRAYNRAAEVFAMGKLLADDGRQDVAPVARATWREPRLLGAMSAAVLLTVTTGWLLVHANSADRNGPYEQSQSSLITTAPVAEFTTSSASQSIRLADSSLVYLAGGTHLAVQFGHTERRLLLEHGFARFYVAHEQRPFVVSAGGGYVVAHGTVFDVAVAANRRVTVGLVEGVIEVTAPMAPNDHARERQRRRLRPGETMSFAAVEAPASTTTNVEALSEPADSSGKAPAGAVDYSSIPVAELVRLADAGSARPIRIPDEAIARLHVSGTFRIDNTDRLADRLAALFDLVVDRSNPAQIVLRSPEGRGAT
ncbi:MAG TPA: FecR domain-containing protein [Sphingomicrobium sp.]|nr:FecR domain-containing protein [Sphingomicrobium sp.]